MSLEFSIEESQATFEAINQLYFLSRKMWDMLIEGGKIRDSGRPEF